MSDTPNTTIIKEGGSSGAGWMIAIVLVIALIAGIWFFTQSNNSNAAKNNAIANAAADVGAAAKQAGNAAQDAADNTKKQ